MVSHDLPNGRFVEDSRLYRTNQLMARLPVNWGEGRDFDDHSPRIVGIPEEAGTVSDPAKAPSGPNGAIRFFEAANCTSRAVYPDLTGTTPSRLRHRNSSLGDA